MTAAPDLNPADVEWTEAERTALRPATEYLPSEWAERKRRLPPKNDAILGRRWLNSNSPPLVVAMDLAVDAGVRELYLQKAAQVGGSECIRNVIGCSADQDPVPWLVVLGDEKSARRIFKDEYHPIFVHTPVLAEQRLPGRGNFSRTSVRLRNGFELDAAWSGSPGSLASTAKCKVLLDECDKYDETKVKEAPPVELARVRTRMFGERAKIFAVSTPTHVDGQIHQLYLSAAIQLRYHVPCPHCGRPQVLHQDRLKWEKFEAAEASKRAALVVAHKAAWFECEHPACGKRIEERHKRDIVARGFWATADLGWRLYPDGRREGTRPPGASIGLHLPGFYSFQLPWWDLAARWILAGSDPKLLQALWNDAFGEPFQQRIDSRADGDFARRCKPDPETGFVPAKRGVVPAWAGRLLLSIDTQKDFFVWVVRAWGYGRRSQRVAHGKASSFAELDEIEQRMWPSEVPDYPPRPVDQAAIDSGGTTHEESRTSRTMQVYEWCRKRPILRLPLKGASRPLDQLVRYRDIDPKPVDGQVAPNPVRLWLFDTEAAAEQLFAAFDGKVSTGDAAAGEDPPAAADLWALNDLNDPDYNKQVANVHKAKIKYRGKMQLRYCPKSTGAPVDYFDAEKMQMVLAIGMNKCTALPTATQIRQQFELKRAAPARPKPPAGGVRGRGGQNFYVNRR